MQEDVVEKYLNGNQMNANQKMMAIAIRKSLLKETHQSNYSSGSSGNSSWSSIDTQRVVYMNDGEEFQVQLFNPENVQVGCLIYINGKLMSNRKIVLRPGERVWLDRHIDTPDKLKFTTYEVGKSKQAQEAIRDNGLVKVEFYREQEKRPEIKLTSISYDPWHYSVCGASEIKCGLNSCENSACAADLSDISTTYADYISTMFSSLQCSEAKAPRHIETGRVDKGSHSEQEFKNVYEEFEYVPFRTEEVKILPMSQKPVRANDLQKRYCPYCGKKTKEGFKFCPFCGKEL